MIDFKRKEFIPASLLTLSSILVLAGTLGFMIFVRPPVVDKNQNRARREIQKVRLFTQDEANKGKLAQAAVEAGTWPGSTDEIGTAARTRIINLATQRKVNVTAFRPQRATKTDELTTLPILITATGGFPAVVAWLQDIERNQTKLAVNLVQFSPAPDIAGGVNATIGVLAYVRPTEEAEPAAGSGTATPARRTNGA